MNFYKMNLLLVCSSFTNINVSITHPNGPKFSDTMNTMASRNMAFFFLVAVAGSNDDNWLLTALPHWQTAFSSWATRSRRNVFCCDKKRNITTYIVC